MESLFSAAGALAMAGWVGLLVAPQRRVANWWLAGLAIPGLLSALYAALLAGWVHYLAFDLFVGAWICRRAAAEGISPWIARLCLPPTFLAGPIGLLLFLVLRAWRAPRQEIRP